MLPPLTEILLKHCRVRPLCRTKKSMEPLRHTRTDTEVCPYTDYDDKSEKSQSQFIVNQSIFLQILRHSGVGIKVQRVTLRCCLLPF